MRSFAPIFVLLATAACAEAGLTGELDLRGADAGPGASGADASSAGDASEPADIPRDPACPASAAWITRISGVVLDETEAPLPAVKAQACMRVAPELTLICLRPVDTDTSGQFALDVPAEGRCVGDTVMRLLLPGSTRAVGYCPLEAPATGSRLVLSEPLRMWGTVPAASLPAAGDGTAVRTVRFADGLELDLVPDAFFGEYAELSAARVPPTARGLCFLDDVPPFDGLYALQPEGDTDGLVAVRIPNTTGLAPGTPVDVFVLGALACRGEDRELLPEGRWTEVQSAVVSADGSRIEVAPGVPCISWIAYRAR